MNSTNTEDRTPATLVSIPSRRRPMRELQRVANLNVLARVANQSLGYVHKCLREEGAVTARAFRLWLQEIRDNGNEAERLAAFEELASDCVASGYPPPSSLCRAQARMGPLQRRLRRCSYFCQISAKVPENAENGLQGTSPNSSNPYWSPRLRPGFSIRCRRTSGQNLKPLAARWSVHFPVQSRWTETVLAAAGLVSV